MTDAELLPTAFQTRRRHRLFAELDNNGRLVRCGAYHRGRALAELEVLEHGVRARYDAADHTEHFDAGEVSRSTAWDGEGDSGVSKQSWDAFVRRVAAEMAADHPTGLSARLRDLNRPSDDGSTAHPWTTWLGTLLLLVALIALFVLSTRSG